MVAQWEEFHDAAHDENLHEICNELDKIFPMLIEVHKNKHKVTPKPASTKPRKVTKVVPNVE